MFIVTEQLKIMNITEYKTKHLFFYYISMKILLDSSNAQTLSFIPRAYPTTVDYTLIEEGTNRTVTGTSIATIDVSGFLTISQPWQLTRDKYYSIDIFDSSDSTLIFRDKIFCTNQDVKAYTINENEYTEDTTYDNDYIIFGEDNTVPSTPTLNSVVDES